MSFYTWACELDTRWTPWSGNVYEKVHKDSTNENGYKTQKLVSYTGVNNNSSNGPISDNKFMGLGSIMNENVAINYRTIANAYGIQDNNAPFTDVNDYLRCINSEETYKKYLEDKRHPTYQTILDYYSNENFDRNGLAKYRIQDFIYLKYFNQIPNNHMLTLRRYIRPCEDHMFGLEMSAEMVTKMNNYKDNYYAIATAVTYMGEQTGNKLSDILKFDYGAKWEDKTAQVESLQSSDGGLAAQMTQRWGVSQSIMNGTARWSELKTGAGIGGVLKFSAGVMGKGRSVASAMASQHSYDGNAFSTKYGDEFYGDLNVVDSVKMRSRGLTFTNSFSLNFEYSLKSLRCVNPRVAMMDILTNFLVLTGNYGNFWGGATIFYGNHNIAPQYGNPQLLREGKYGQYLGSLWNDMKQGFNNLAESYSNKKAEDQSPLEKLWNVAKGILTGSFTALIGNIFGGNIGVAGQSQVPKALLSGAPSGYWHLTVGNPLDPIAMMGNMAVTKTTVQFNDILGYDDFPTEIKFTVEMEHAKPRDNAQIEAMFNAGKGRFYAFSPELEKRFHQIDFSTNFKSGNGGTQEAQVAWDNNGKQYKLQTSNHNYKDPSIVGGTMNL